MKSSLIFLLCITLLCSVGLNIYLLSGNSVDLPLQQTFAEEITQGPASGHQSTETTPASEITDQQTNTMPTNVLSTAQSLIDQGALQQALEVVQRALRQRPDDISLLLMEADLLARDLGPGDALANYYSLLALPLSDKQRQTLLDKIEHLGDFHIGNLWRLKSWDVLSDFLEPLWQFAPNHRGYILPLAEAYAHQRLQAPMENVLASLLPEDPDVERIRQLLYQNQQQLAPQPASTFDDKSAVAQGTPLRQLGDHYIVNGQMNNKSVELMIDTGASTTVLTENAFNRIASGNEVSFIGQYRINTAGGQVVAPVYKMQTLNIDGHRVNDLAVVVLPLEEFGDAEGLLGMNFLREFDFRIDQNSDQLFLNDRR